MVMMLGFFARMEHESVVNLGDFQTEQHAKAFRDAVAEELGSDYRFDVKIVPVVRGEEEAPPA